MSKQLQYRKKSKDFFMNYSKEKESSQQRFLSSLNIMNKTTGEIFDINYTLKNTMDKVYHNITQRSIDLQNYTKEIGFNGCSFLTLTLDTMYQKYTTKNSKKTHQKNKNYRGFSIHDGYQKLIKTFETIHKQFFRDKIDFKYIRVIEPHKSFTAHLHVVLYYKNVEDFKRLLNIVGNKIEKKSIEKIKKDDGNIKYLLKGNDGIGRVELEEIKDRDRGAAYLLKYIRKSFKDGEESMYMLDGWKRFNKIRLVSSSNNIVPNYIYNKIYSHLPKEIKESKELSSLTWCRKNININMKNTIFEDGKFKELKGGVKLFNENNHFDVYVEKENKKGISDINERMDTVIEFIKDESNRKKYSYVIDEIRSLYYVLVETTKIYTPLESYLKNLLEVRLEKWNNREELQNIYLDIVETFKRLYNEFKKNIQNVKRIMIFNNESKEIVYDSNDFECFNVLEFDDEY